MIAGPAVREQGELKVRPYLWAEAPARVDSAGYSDPPESGQALDEIVYASEMVGVPDGHGIGWGGLLAHYRRALDSLEQHWGLGRATGNSTASPPGR